MIEVESLKSGFRIGEWRANPGLGTLSRHGRIEHPSRHAMEILLILAANEGRVISRQDLVARVWDNPAVGNVPLNRCMHELGALFDDPSYIRNIPGRGYRIGQAVIPEPLSERLANRSGRSAVAVVAALLAAAVAVTWLLFGLT